MNDLQGQHWSGWPGVSSPPIRKTGKIREDTGMAFVLGIKLTLSIAIDYIKINVDTSVFEMKLDTIL